MRIGVVRLLEPLRHRDIKLLIAGLGLSQGGDWLYNVALIAFVLEGTGSAAWVAAAGVVRLLPYALLGSLGGMIADTRSRRRTMIASDVLRATIMFVLAAVAGADGSPAVVIALAGAATIFSVAYGPSVNAAIPRLVAEEDLSGVNTLSTTVTNLSYALGPAVGGVLLLLGSPTAAFVVNGCTFLGSALTTLAIRADLGPDVVDATAAEAGERTGPRIADGFRALRTSALVIALVAVQIATSVLYGIETVLYALASQRLLGLGVDGIAFLYAAIGVGGIAAAGLAHRLADRSELGGVLAAASVACGLPMLGLAVVREPAAALALLLIEGAAMIVVDVLVVTSLQRLLGGDVLGRVFGTLDSLIVVGILTGAIAAPVLVSAASLEVALLVGGGVMLASGLAVLRYAGRIDASVEAQTEALRPRVATLRRLRIFRGSSRATLERIAEVLLEEDVLPGAVLIREGDPADDLFVLTAGSLEVSVGEDGHARTVAHIAPGDYVGEIGLLHGVPRTATVRATVASRVYRIPGDRFLEAVSQGAVRSRALSRTARARMAAGQSVRRGGQSVA